MSQQIQYVICALEERIRKLEQLCYNNGVQHDDEVLSTRDSCTAEPTESYRSGESDATNRYTARPIDS